MPTVRIGKGYKIHYIDEGDGLVNVYLHGFLGSAWMFKNQVNHFSKKYRVIAIDQLGHGESDKPENENYYMEDFADFLEQTLQKIIGNEKIILHGHSMGGMIALTYATIPSLTKRIKGLVLMGTTAKLGNSGLISILENLTEQKKKFVERSIIEKVHTKYCFNRKFMKSHPEVIETFTNKTLENKEFIVSKTVNAFVFGYNVEDKLNAINVPTLILTGDKDRYIPLEHSKFLNDNIPNSELIVFTPDIGHLFHFEVQDKYHKVLDEFLKSLL